jgi:DNA invertase Pin-like site-specific DNA recombinase
MGLLHLGGGILQNLQVLRRNREYHISAGFRLQKYAAKGSLYARTFAKHRRRGTAVRIGYARVSTQDQKLDLQLKALKKAGCQRIFREKVSGFKRQRSEFERMLDQIRPGDVIVVWKLDRLARSTRDLLNTMDTINEAGGKFQSVSEPWADTTTHAGKMIMTVFAGIAEFERDLIRERTGAGREAAKQRGVRFGRPRKLNTDQAQIAAQLLAEGKPVRDIARTFNVHEATIYRLAAAS